MLSAAALTFEGVNDTTTAADAAAGNGSVVVGAGLLATLGGTVALRGALPSFGLDLVEGAADPIAAATFEKAPLRPALSAGGLMNLTTAAARRGGAAARLVRAEDEPALRGLLDGVALRPACAGAGCAGLAQLSLPLEWFVPLAFPRRTRRRRRRRRRRRGVASTSSVSAATFGRTTPVYASAALTLASTLTAGGAIGAFRCGRLFLVAGCEERGGDGAIGGAAALLPGDPLHFTQRVGVPSSVCKC